MNMKNIHLEIVTPERLAYSEDVDALFVPTINGTIGVLPRHVQLFTALSEGEIKIQSGTKEIFMAIGGGFMEITQNKVTILVSRAYHANELNESEIKKAQQAAQDVLARKVKGTELADAQSMLRRSILELKVIRRVRHREVPQIPS